MTVSHLGHSVFATVIATGPASVRPCRTPPVISTLSCSNFIRAPRPYPARLRASAAATSAPVTSTPAGNPSQIATRALPGDSPAVSQRSMQSILPCPATRLCARVRGSRERARAAQPDGDAAAQPAAKPLHHRAPYFGGELSHLVPGPFV